MKYLGLNFGWRGVVSGQTSVLAGTFAGMVFQPNTDAQERVIEMKDWGDYPAGFCILALSFGIPGTPYRTPDLEKGRNPLTPWRGSRG